MKKNRFEIKTLLLGESVLNLIFSRIIDSFREQSPLPTKPKSVFILFVLLLSMHFYQSMIHFECFKKEIAGYVPVSHVNKYLGLLLFHLCMN